MIDKSRLKQHLRDIAKQTFSYNSSTIAPHKFAEERRILSEAESPSRPGPFSYEHTPLTKEIIDCLASTSPVNTIAIMKSAQYGVSEGLIINGLLYIMSEAPGPTMFLSGDQSLSKAIIEKRLDPAIKGAGLRHLLQPTVARARGNRTGDTSAQKEFRGGFIMADGILNLEAKMRQETIQYGFFDDWERAPRSTKEGGDTFGLTQTRMSTLGFRRKAFYISTPEIEQTSSILPLYERGDQRKWHIECPRCNEMIDLVWRGANEDGSTLFIDGETTGVMFDVKKNKVVKDSVHYRCQKCGGTFTESEKFRLVPKGRWIATTESSEQNFRSYHINALYSPPGQKGWMDFAEQFQAAHPRGGKPNNGMLHVFNNTVLGLCWKEKGKAPSTTKIQRNTRNYKPWVVPNALSIEDGNGPIVAVTLASDLNGQTNDARIDWEIVAWSKAGPSYSVAHGSIGTFQRSTAKRAKASLAFAEKEANRLKWNYNHNTPYNVWDELEQLGSKELITDDGNKFNIAVAIVDVSNTFSDEEGENPRAYQFIDKLNNGVFWGAKGADDPRIRKTEQDRAYYKKSKAKNNLFILDVDLIKDDLSSAMDGVWADECLQPYDFCNFPQPSDGMYTAKFFDQFGSEERTIHKDSHGNPSGYKWKKRSSTSQNHYWDCRVYGLFARQFVYTEVCKEYDQIVSWESYCNYIGL